MAQLENSEGKSAAGEPSTSTEGYAIIVTPGENEGVVFGRLPDGRPSMTFTGEVTIFPTDSDKLPEWLLTAASRESGTQTPETTQTPDSGDYSEQDKPSSEQSPIETGKQPETGNQKHTFVGNPAYDAAYWVRKSGKRIAEFVLDTHPEEGKTEAKRIRWFDDLAEHVRDNVRRGQTDVKVRAYGVKTWKNRKGEAVQGYYGYVVNGESAQTLAKKAQTSPDS